MEAGDRQVTTVFTVQPSFHHRYHEALPSSADVQSHLTSLFADGSMILGLSRADNGVTDCENCRHLTVVGLHDTGPWGNRSTSWLRISGASLCVSLPIHFLCVPAFFVLCFPVFLPYRPIHLHSPLQPLPFPEVGM